MALATFQLEFVPNSQAALNQIKTFLENRLASSGIEITRRDADWSGNMQDGVCLILRVARRQDAEDLIDFIQNNLSQLASRSTGKISVHVCKHEDGDPGDCRNEFYRERKF